MSTKNGFTCSPDSGTGNKKLIISVNANKTLESKNSSFDIQGGIKKTITCIQNILSLGNWSAISNGQLPTYFLDNVLYFEASDINTYILTETSEQYPIDIKVISNIHCTPENGINNEQLNFILQITDVPKDVLDLISTLHILKEITLIAPINQNPITIPFDISINVLATNEDIEVVDSDINILGAMTNEQIDNYSSSLQSCLESGSGSIQYVLTDVENTIRITYLFYFY